ncbi:MAG: MarC family protein [Planctomycetota bacterium JB042]
MIDWAATFIYFFAVIDPIGTVPVFIAVTREHQDHRRRIAFVATAIAAGILVSFVVVGEIVLTAMGISLAAFQVAGGIVLFLFALSMIFGSSKPEDECQLAEQAADTAVFPLAVPSIASPGAMLAAVLLTENARFSLVQQAATTATMLAVLLVTLGLMLVAGRVHRLVGDTGASVISRVMGLILASVATASALAGIEAYFDL